MAHQKQVAEISKKTTQEKINTMNEDYDIMHLSSITGEFEEKHEHKYKSCYWEPDMTMMYKKQVAQISKITKQERRKKKGEKKGESQKCLFEIRAKNSEADED